MEYSSKARRLFAAPLHSGELPPGDPERACGEAEDRALSVWVRFQLRVTGGVIRAVRYRAFGCPHAIAAAEYVAEKLEGRPVSALAGLDMRAVSAALEVPAEKYGKLLRIEDALAACRRSLAARMELNHGDITD